MTGTRTAVTPRTDVEAVDAFLDALAGGRPVPDDLFAADATLDATVPDWRFGRLDGPAIRAQFAHWFADPGTYDELDRTPIPGGEVVRFALSWTEGGVPHACHQIHVLTVEGGRIVADTMFCGGRWDAGLLAQMEDARVRA